MEQQIVFFDDICVLCSRSVRFIYRHDRKERFLFASFDSEAFRRISHLLPDRDRPLPDQDRPLPDRDRLQSGRDHLQPGLDRPTDPPDNFSHALPDSVVLYRKGKVYLRSGAALRIAMMLRFPLPLLAAFLVVPSFIRNAVYDWIARNRYRWFGKRETCFLPDDDLKDRFLA
ncbi:MAG: DCC1-like thiol-disulfide oxidoreductase family protein [Bacteroidales bacterium]|nr:DCC1-like thiol-disulfide oxidoreductase family protein [Bacteroidales bacterium]